MTSEQAESVTSLVTRFVLRRRADVEAYKAGTRLAYSGAVELVRVEPSRVSAVVHDLTPFDVCLFVDGGQLASACICSSRLFVCRHAVATAHALWLVTAPQQRRPQSE